MPEILSDSVRHLLDVLPPGKMIGPGRHPHPVVWLSNSPLVDAADRWKQLYARRSQTGLYPLLLEYPDDSFRPAEGPYGTDADAGSFLLSQWRNDAWPPFKGWPGLAKPAGMARDPDVCAGEVATAVARGNRARCLALVQVERGADAPAALGWLGMTNHMTAQDLSAVLRSWEDRFGVRVVGFGHGSLFLSVAGRPTEIHQARVLAAEHYLVCPDIFFEDPDLDWDTYHEELMQSREWRFWWD